MSFRDHVLKSSAFSPAPADRDQVHTNTGFAPARVDGAGSRGHETRRGPGTLRSDTSEHSAQVRLLKEVGRRGLPGVLVFAVPNAARRSMKLAAKMRAEGMRAGVADLVFTIPPTGRAAYLEMKREKGGVTSDEQRRFAREAVAAGALHAVAKGFDEAVAVLEQWGILQ